MATREVTDRGFPLTSEGLQKFFHLTAEQQKRDQQFHGMYIYNDWTGYGMTEVMDNYVSCQIFAEAAKDKNRAFRSNS